MRSEGVAEQRRNVRSQQRTNSFSFTFFSNPESPDKAASLMVGQFCRIQIVKAENGATISRFIAALGVVYSD